MIRAQLLWMFLKETKTEINQSDVIIFKAFLTHYLGVCGRSSHFFFQARHAAEIRADSIALIAPSFYKPATAGIQ